MTTPQPSDTPRADQWADRPALSDDPGWKMLRESAIAAPTATVVGAVCDYAEKRVRDERRDLLAEVARKDEQLAEAQERLRTADYASRAMVEDLRAALVEHERQIRETEKAAARNRQAHMGAERDLRKANARAEQAERERDHWIEFANGNGRTAMREQALREQAERERDEALRIESLAREAQGEAEADSVLQRKAQNHWREKYLAEHAAAEQAERQAREMPEQIAQAIEALGVPDDVAADGPSTSEAYVFHHTKARAAQIARALSGVSRPTAEAGE